MIIRQLLAPRNAIRVCRPMNEDLSEHRLGSPEPDWLSPHSTWHPLGDVELSRMRNPQSRTAHQETAGSDKRGHLTIIR